MNTQHRIMKKIDLKIVLMFWIVYILFFFGQSTVFSQTREHSYPRIGIFQWSGAVDEWWARHDVAMFTIPSDINSGREWAKRILALNPDIILMPTVDWNYGMRHYEEIPDEWFLRASNGDKLMLYGSNTGLYMLNITDYCPKVNGKRYNEYISEWMLTKVDLNYFGGIATDGLHDFPWGQSDVDYDRNGVNDFDEHGKTWVRNTQTAGAEKALQNARNLIGDNKMLLVNSGGFHNYSIDITNGAVFEHFTNTTDMTYLLKQYRKWEENVKKPHISIIDGRIDPKESGDLGKNNFRDMRYTLGFTLMYGGYYTGQPYEAGEHYFTAWYDEFDTELGQPKDFPVEVSKNVLVRFFQNGAVIFNGSGSNYQITDGEIQGLPGYEGPYYFFHGNQNPDYNNGSKFSSLTLEGRDESGKIEGDAVILLKTPLYVASDIIIDDSEAGTSPSVQATEISGNWTTIYEQHQYGDAYTMRTASWHRHVAMSAFHYVEPANGEAKATFKIKVGLSGNYKVFEWHGFIGDSRSSMTEGTNVPHRVRDANGETTIKVDQSTNSGQWNLLGKFQFHRGAGYFMEISNAANGGVIADAIKLVYQDNSNLPEVDSVPPAKPRGVQIKVKND